MVMAQYGGSVAGRSVGQMTERYHWICHAYCLMTNHYDLVAETVEGNLSQGMRHLNAARAGSAD